MLLLFATQKMVRTKLHHKNELTAFTLKKNIFSAKLRFFQKK
jgi:hypothetical protein